MFPFEDYTSRDACDPGLTRRWTKTDYALLFLIFQPERAH